MLISVSPGQYSILTSQVLSNLKAKRRPNLAVEEVGEPQSLPPTQLSRNQMLDLEPDSKRAKKISDSHDRYRHENMS